MPTDHIQPRSGCTVNKFQGGKTPLCLFWVPEGASAHLSRQVVHTAVGRAQDRFVAIVTSAATLNQPWSRLNTLLRPRLLELQPDAGQAGASAAAEGAAELRRRGSHLGRQLLKRRAVPQAVRDALVLATFDRATRAAPCPTCAATMKMGEGAGWHVSHRQAVKFGGANDLDNLLIQCWRCNNEQGVQDYEAFLEWKRSRSAHAAPTPAPPPDIHTAPP